MEGCLNGRICVLCPTRDRPHGFGRLCESVAKTSTKADVRGWVDEDQIDDYPIGWGDRDLSGALRFSWHTGPRIGPVAAANRMVEFNPRYDVYGFMTDDSVVTTPGWDEWALDVVKQFPNRVCVISPHHNMGNHVDMPFVSKEWIKAVGWYACPEFFHYVWPTVTGLIGEMTAIIHAPSQSFSIEHDDHIQDRGKQLVDEAKFYEFTSLRLPPIVERVREAMKS